MVREQLDRKQIESFLPTITRWSRWKDRKKKIDWPLFQATASRASTPPTRCGLEVLGGRDDRVLRGKPAAIPDRELESIRLLVGSDSSTIRAR